MVLGEPLSACAQSELLLRAMGKDGGGTILTLAITRFEQFIVLVTISVYAPEPAVPGFGIAGLKTLDVKFRGPVHRNVFPEYEFALSVMFGSLVQKTPP